MTASTAGTSNCFTAKSLDISLAALKRQDPYINNIVDVASQVALYTFSNKANEWEKTDVEGTLFVYTRLASPRHGFTIMNRLSMDNLTEPITKDLDFQLQDPFLLYRNARYLCTGLEREGPAVSALRGLQLLLWWRGMSVAVGPSLSAFVPVNSAAVLPASGDPASQAG
uniref:5'-(N(7)-methylguanosine 5'-triphospho)-[mRNA] hydrolase n=1 Tax=Paramormyrops kingsleyae TaxID=1676925 RepID=A0A3B3R3Y3_9TELE